MSRAQKESQRIEVSGKVLSGKLTARQAAERYGVTANTVHFWVRTRREGGESALRRKAHPGRPKFLTEKQHRKLEKLLLCGAVKAGFSTDLWTCRRVAKLIKDEFGVCYHVNHVFRVMARLGWTPQKPERRAKERDEEAIERWVKRDWPRIQKKSAPKESQARLR